MHVFTFSVRHYKPRTCYKSLPHAVEPIGTDTMQNQQRIVIVLGSTLKGIVAVTRGLSVGKAERVHGMCWCDTHSWLQYDGGISGSCCYGSCWSFRSNVQCSAWKWLCLETRCTSHWMLLPCCKHTFSACGSYGRKITSWFPSAAHLLSTCIFALTESIPHTALTEATLVGKRLHSRFRLTGLTGLTLSDGAGHDLFVRQVLAQDSEHTVPLKYQVSLCALKQTSSSAELKVSTLRTVGLEFTASRLKTAGAMGKGHMVQGKLASAGAVHCLQRNRDTQTLGH